MVYALEVETTARPVPVVNAPVVNEKLVPVASSAVAMISPPERIKSPSVTVRSPKVRVMFAVPSAEPANVATVSESVENKRSPVVPGVKVRWDPAPVVSKPAATKSKELMSRMVPSIDMLPASPVSLMVMAPVVPDTSNSVKSMAAAKPRMMLSPTLRALVISASETSKASVITPLALVARIRRPSAVVTAPVESRVASMPVDEEARIIPDPVPAFSMDMTEPEEVA